MNYPFTAMAMAQNLDFGYAGQIPMWFGYTVWGPV